MQVGLTPEQQNQKDKWGWEFYFEPATGKMEFSQVRTNMMENINYVPYCMTSGCHRYSKTDVIETLRCCTCGEVIIYPKEFIDRYKEKHRL